MRCPECQKEMQIMCVTDEHKIIIGKEIYVTSTVIGRCWGCDLDFEWERRECGLRRYFHG